MVELRVTPSSLFPANCYCQHHLLPAFTGVGLVQIAAIDTRLEQSAHGCSSTIGTKVSASAKMTVTSVIMNRDGFQTCCNSLRLATAVLCRMERLWEPLPLSRSRIVPAICLVVESALSWIISLSVFPGFAINPGLSL